MVDNSWMIKESPLRSTGTTSPDWIRISPTTSPEILYNTSQLKASNTHEKNVASPDINVSHVDDSHINVSHVDDSHINVSHIDDSHINVSHVANSPLNASETDGNISPLVSGVHETTAVSPLTASIGTCSQVVIDSCGS